MDWRNFCPRCSKKMETDEGFDSDVWIEKFCQNPDCEVKLPFQIWINDSDSKVQVWWAKETKHQIMSIEEFERILKLQSFL